jgi:hypothetical protein
MPQRFQTPHNCFRGLVVLSVVSGKHINDTLQVYDDTEMDCLFIPAGPN